MRNIALLISYTGTKYSGFQAQPGGQKTIQGYLEKALAKLTGERIELIGSGRTDAGVHARGQVANFHSSSQIPLIKWAIALNSMIPRDIVVHTAREVPPDFHARKSAVRKTYRYTIYNHRIPDVFRKQSEYIHPIRLNVAQMKEALPCLKGTHDFSSFCSLTSTKTSHIRTIEDIYLHDEIADVPAIEARRMHLYVRGDGFLYKMIRIITGTLMQIGEGKRKPSDMLEILQQRNRALAGPTARPEGLTLWEVEYAFELFT